MQPLPPEALPTIPHVAFWIFDLAIPNVIVLLALLLAFIAATWARLPRVLEPEGERQEVES